jgi:hypothetical protein
MALTSYKVAYTCENHFLVFYKDIWAPKITVTCLKHSTCILVWQIHTLIYTFISFYLSLSCIWKIMKVIMHNSFFSYVKMVNIYEYQETFHHDCMLYI